MKRKTYNDYNADWFRAHPHLMAMRELAGVEDENKMSKDALSIGKKIHERFERGLHPIEGTFKTIQDEQKLISCDQARQYAAEQSPPDPEDEIHDYRDVRGS